MVAFKSTLLLLSAASTVFALPASTKNPEYGINGELLDSDVDKRSNYYAPPYPGMQQLEYVLSTPSNSFVQSATLVIRIIGP
jgi:hypothetical protein